MRELPGPGTNRESLSAGTRVKQIKLDKKSVTLLKGKTVTLKATVLPSDATTKTVVWKSSKPSVASVSKSGKVTAKKGVTAVITAKGANDVSASCKITVKIPSTKVKLNKTKANMKKGNELKLKASMTPSDSTDKLTWTSSDTKTATVKNGVVIAKKPMKSQWIHRLFWYYFNLKPDMQ